MITGDASFFLVYDRELVKLPDVALLAPKIESRSVDYHQEQLIQQIRTTWYLSCECTQQAQQRMELQRGIVE